MKCLVSHTAATEQRMMPKPKAQPLKDVVVCAAMGGKTEEQKLAQRAETESGVGRMNPAGLFCLF